MVTLEFHDPAGAARGEAAARAAPRFARRQAHRLRQQRAVAGLPHAAALEDAARAGFHRDRGAADRRLPAGQRPDRTEETAALVKRSGVDAVIIGNAA